jgi:protein-disulfide isomerase
MIVSPLNKSDHLLGNRYARIEVLVYEDYECEYCGKAFRELKELTKHFKKEVCFAYRHFPFVKIHPHAMLAAVVVEACALQNKFIEAHDCIFRNQEYLEYGLGGILRLLEKKHSVCLKKLNEDLEKRDVARKINDDIESGMRCDIKNTPAIFINGEMYAGDGTVLKLEKVITRLINRSPSKNISP